MTAIKFCVWTSIWVAVIALPLPCLAAAVLPDNFQLQGFAAQSLICSSRYNFFGDTRDRVDTRFSELGLNAQWQPASSLLLSGQILHRRAGNSDEQGVRVDYAQADWLFLNQPSSRLGIKFGKTKIPYGLYNETRDVPATRAGVLLPQSIYFDSIRDFVLAAPGAFLHGTQLGDLGAFEFNLGWVHPDFGSPSLRANVLGNVLGELHGGGALAASARWEPTPDTTLALTYVDFSAQYRPAPHDFLGAGTLDVTNFIASLQQRIDTLTLTAELSAPRYRLKDFGGPDVSRTSLGGYVQGEWRFAPNWQAMLRYDVLENDKQDANGKQYQALTGLPGYTQFARDWTLGLRWDITPHWMLRGEVHHVNGTAWLPSADNVSRTDGAHWDMGLLQGAYRF
jgi:hypothetical protein